jgi:hypothetical protein
MDRECEKDTWEWKSSLFHDLGTVSHREPPHCPFHKVMMSSLLKSKGDEK